MTTKLYLITTCSQINSISCTIFKNVHLLCEPCSRALDLEMNEELQKVATGSKANRGHLNCLLLPTLLLFPLTILYHSLLKSSKLYIVKLQRYSIYGEFPDSIYKIIFPHLKNCFKAFQKRNPCKGKTSSISPP